MFMGPQLEDLIPIVAIVCTFIFFMRLLKLAHAKAQLKQDSALGRRLDELQTELEARDRVIQRLETRIRVLERIVTDDSRRLGDEIERLRA